jgi:glucosamine--fructose-6-phosphate aminotransferase (isomerizing)
MDRVHADSMMEQEAFSAPEKVAELIARGRQERDAVVAALSASSPGFALTVGRGSSDHACSFAAWSFARWLGLPTMSLPPSLITRDAVNLQVRGALLLAISQSGRGADVVPGHGRSLWSMILPLLSRRRPNSSSISGRGQNEASPPPSR